ncbi:MAG TPA: hypothetical protein VGR39_06615, partial [Candidatus Acidoferrales bacterium]|nr:hypothetical protein [Candidatus Acidoferrales bacterium]
MTKKTRRNTASTIFVGICLLLLRGIASSAFAQQKPVLPPPPDTQQKTIQQAPTVRVSVRLVHLVAAVMDR